MFGSITRTGDIGSVYEIQELRKGRKRRRWNMECVKLDPSQFDVDDLDWTLRLWPRNR